MISVTLWAAVLFALPSYSTLGLRPPTPDKALTPNSSTAPDGCKLLASDKGWPTDEEWRKALPGAFKKLKGTLGPDWSVQPSTPEEVQAAVNFARDRNVRLTIVSSGHDFHGRGQARSGLRIDMSGLREPTVFSKTWACGKSVLPRSISGREVHNTQACKLIDANGQPEYHYFEKSDGHTCDTLVARHLTKRANKLFGRSPQSGPAGYDVSKPWEWAVKTGYQLPKLAEYVPSFNIIKPDVGKGGFVRITAGMNNEEVYHQAAHSGLMSMGGQHPTVAPLGGYSAAGGHNPFAHKFGMTADNIVEIEFVSPDGKLQKASACQNPDIFWALRGGGGSTFGVVVAATLKVHPTFPVVVSRFFVNTTDYSPKLWDAVAHFLKQGPGLRDKHGLQGYFYVYANAFHSVLHMPDQYATVANAKKAVEPLQKKMEELAGAVHIEPEYISHKTYKDWYVDEMGSLATQRAGKQFRSWADGSAGDVPSLEDAMKNPLVIFPGLLKEKQAGLARRQAKAQMPRIQPMARTYLDSRLFGEKELKQISDKDLANAVNGSLPRLPGNVIRGFLLGGGKQAEPHPDALGLLPAWRAMSYHWIVTARPASTRHDYNMRHLDKVWPNLGAYVNEANPAEPEWKKVFWGRHYAQLEATKKRLDPQNVLWCSPCVGADMLTYDDERICKNPAYPQAGPPSQAIENIQSRVGISSLPGEAGIPDPLAPILQDYLKTGQLPKALPGPEFFKMPMGEGGSGGGTWSLGPGTSPPTALRQAEG